jgi:DNA primase
MDALAAAGCGFPAIAILGAAPPSVVYDHVANLVNKSYQKGTAIIIPDNDRLGAWVNTQQELGARGIGAMLMPIYSGYKDLAEMPEQERMEFLNES